MRPARICDPIIRFVLPLQGDPDLGRTRYPGRRSPTSSSSLALGYHVSARWAES